MKQEKCVNDWCPNWNKMRDNGCEEWRRLAHKTCDKFITEKPENRYKEMWEKLKGRINFITLRSLMAEIEEEGK